MSPQAALTHLVSPPGQNGEDQNPDWDVDLTNDNSENVPPIAVGGVGGPCGHLSNASNIPFLSSKMRNVTLMHATDNLPEDLKEVNASGWNDGGKLLELFKLPAGTVRDGITTRKEKKAYRMFPACLIQDAKTVADKMRVVSWWLSLEKKEMKTQFDALKNIYRAPSKDNERLRRPGSGDNAEAYSYAGSCDSLERR
jgi:hypothetical protein